jgi:prevent-host-death family protein
MPGLLSRGAEDARNELPALLQGAMRGQATVITRRGQPVAALVSMDQFESSHRRQAPLLPLIGTGKGLWGKDSRLTLHKLRNEWDR